MLTVYYDGTHTRPFNRPFLLRLPWWAGTRKVKPIWILLKHETASGSGISWAICKSASRFRQITTPAPHHSVFTGRPTNSVKALKASILWWYFVIYLQHSVQLMRVLLVTVAVAVLNKWIKIVAVRCLLLSIRWLCCIFDTTRVLKRSTVELTCIHLSICQPLQQHAAGLLLCAPQQVILSDSFCICIYSKHGRLLIHICSSTVASSNKSSVMFSTSCSLHNCLGVRHGFENAAF